MTEHRHVAGYQGTLLPAVLASSGSMGAGTSYSYVSPSGKGGDFTPWTGATFPIAATVFTSITRSSNTTTYTVNTGWNNGTPTVFTFANVCPSNGGNAVINAIGLSSNNNPTLLLSGVLWLFSVMPATVIHDDSTFNIATADFANLVESSTNGYPFVLQSAQASGAGNSGVSLTGTNYPARCAVNSRTLYGMVEVANAYVPASAEVLTVTLTAVGAQ